MKLARHRAAEILTEARAEADAILEQARGQGADGRDCGSDR